MAETTPPTVTPPTTPSPTSKWSSGGYWDKARAYYVMGAARGGEDPPFMSTLAMEFLARAVLTKINPALNADQGPTDDGVSILHACGFPVPGNPQTVQMKTVYARLEKIAPNEFTPTLSKKCRALTNLRNGELHTADTPYVGLKPSAWLPIFYEAAAVFCTLLSEPLEDFLGREEATIAREMIKATKRDQLSSVQSRIASYRKVFNDRPEKDRDALRAKVSFRPRYRSHPCPACDTLGAIDGRPIRETDTLYNPDGRLNMVTTHSTDSFSCAACGLKLASLEEVIAAGMEPTFSVTEEWEPEGRTDDGAEYDNM